MATKKDCLSPRQRRFVTEYVVKLNATQAAIRAGYSPKGADVQGVRLLGNAKVAIAVEEAQRIANEKIQGKVDITRERVLEELALLAFSDVTQFEVTAEGKVKAVDGAPPGAVRAIASVKMRTHIDSEGGVTRDAEIRLWDKPGMVKLAGRHMDVRGFSDRVELTGKDGGPMEVAARAEMTTAEKRARLQATIAKAKTVSAGVAQYQQGQGATGEHVPGDPE